GWSWFRFWVRPKPGITAEHVRQPLQAAFLRDRRERVKDFAAGTHRQVIDAYLSERILLLPAAAGASSLQKDYRRPLLILSALVALVLLVACVNVANLMTAQSSARAREMALRVSIGAGRWRLVQLVLVESAMLACGASVLGALFAAWAAPLVTSMLRVPGDPVRLILETGWRELAFSGALAMLVTLLFGLAPALRASAVHPIHALKGTGDTGSRPRIMQTLLAAQVAFCIVVLFIAGLFLKTFQRLSNRPLGFSPERVLVIDAASRREQPASAWMDVAYHILQTPGVQSVALSGWPLLSENRWTGAVRLPGRTGEIHEPYFLDVSPGFFETMRIGLIDGRDFRPGDLPPRVQDGARLLPGVGIVNETFARTYFEGRNPVGRSVEVGRRKNLAPSMEIVGYVRDAAYRNLREPILPTVYVPMEDRGHVTVLVRTAGDSLPLAPVLRREVTAARPDVRVVQVQPQDNFIRWHLVRERVLAALSVFFAVVALALAAIGLYGVLNYSVVRQSRDIGIRMALGARSMHVLRGVAGQISLLFCVGSAVGLAGGVASGRVVEALLFEVQATGFGTIAAPILTLAGVAVLAALPPAMRAARIDPAQTLRND
ncbi:MAG: FtsX-like permease family protein, partial [Bryobacteraceae bacterium]